MVAIISGSLGSLIGGNIRGLPGGEIISEKHGGAGIFRVRKKRNDRTKFYYSLFYSIHLGKQYVGKHFA